MNKLYCLIGMFITCGACSGQNLVPNGDFESYSPCPNNVDALGFAIPWLNPAAPFNMSSPDYFNQCTSNPWIDVPNNFVGYQSAHSGVAYAGAAMIYYQYSNFREYLEIPLDRALLADSCYYFQMYVNLGNNSKYATNAIGVYFSDTLIDNFISFPLQFSPQITNNAGFIIDTLNWTLVSGNYVATGGESYLIIGNFLNDLNTPTVIVDSTAIWIRAYYYFDDVSLIQIPSCSNGLDENNKAVYTKLFPNPFHNKLNIISKSNEFSEVILYDIASRKLFQQSYTTSTSINTEQFTNGIYLYEVRNKNGVMVKGKIVKI